MKIMLAMITVNAQQLVQREEGGGLGARLPSCRTIWTHMMKMARTLNGPWPMNREPIGYAA